MLYELKNPSDPYVFEADSLEVATLTVYLLSTAFGAEPIEGDGDVPIMLFGDAEEYYKEKFGRDVKTGFESNFTSVRKAMASFMLGNFSDYKRYQAALNAITDEEKRKTFIDEWQDNRSSLNNIGGKAHQIAEMMLKQEQEMSLNSSNCCMKVVSDESKS